MADKKALIAVAVIAVVIIAACAALMLNNSGGSEKPSEKETVTVTDLAGREVKLEVPLKKIVCGDAEAMTLIAAVAGSDFKNMVVGYDSNFKTYYPDQKRMWESGGMDFSKMSEVGSFQDGNFNWEAVASLNPDAVFIPMWCYEYGMVSEDTVKNMANKGVPVVHLDLYMSKLDPSTMQKNCDILGKIFNNKATADKVSSFYKSQVEKVSSKLSQVPAEKYTYYFEMMTALESYGGTNSTNSTMYLNQKNIVSGPGSSVNPEAFATGDVSFAFLGAFSAYSAVGKNIGWGSTVTQSDIDGYAEALSKRAGWNESPAAKNKEVYVVNGAPISNMDCWFLYQLNAKTMFPEIYGDLDPIGTLGQFYKDFIPWISAKGVWYFSTGGKIGQLTDEGGKETTRTITVTDLAGRQVEVSTPVKKIVCGDAEAMTLIAAVAGQDFTRMVVGYDSNFNTYYPDLKAMWEDAGMDFGKMTETGSFMQGTFNWETVASLDPDVVFIPTWCYVYGMISEDTVNNMAKAGIPIVNLDLFLNRLDTATMQKNCDILGAIFSNKTTSDRLFSFYKEQIEKVSSKLSQVPADKYQFYYEILTHLGTYGQSNADSNKIFLGQKDIMSGISGDVISPEAFSTSGVDFIFLDTMRSYAECGKVIGWNASATKADIDSIAESLSKRQGWSLVPAVENKKVYLFDNMSLGSMFDVWFIYQFLAQKMFPDVYGDLGSLETLDDYYEEFLPWVDFKGVWYLGLDGEIGRTS